MFVALHVVLLIGLLTNRLYCSNDSSEHDSDLSEPNELGTYGTYYRVVTVDTLDASICVTLFR
jgi:hypothetical protein